MEHVRIAVLSDLHVEFDRAAQERRAPRRRGQRRDLEAAGHPRVGPNLGALDGHCDLVVLAGDIDLGVAAAVYAAAVADWLAVPVVLVAGNHEFYGFDVGPTLADLRAAAADHPGVHFLENDVLDLTVGQGRLRVLGCTLWTDFALFGADRRAAAERYAATAMTDFNGTIRCGPERPFTPQDSVRIHAESRAWLADRLDGRDVGPTLVVTHHAPSRGSVATRYRKDLLSAAFASDLDDLVASPGVALWVHGHTHDSFDYRVGGTRVVCNPRGYHPFELNKRFDPGLIVSV